MEQMYRSTLFLTSASDGDGWLTVNATLRPLYPREWRGTHCTVGWVGPRASQDGCGKYRPHRDSIPVPSKSVGSHYTDKTIPAHIIIIIIIIIIITIIIIIIIVTSLSSSSRRSSFPKSLW